MLNNQIVVTIDGPAGAGKTTVSRMLAEKLGYKYIDTGALYRGIALEVKQSGIDPEDDKALELVFEKIELKFVQTEGGLRLYSSGQDVSDKIRTPEISMMASAVAAKPAVREYLLSLQRKLGEEKCAVFEGRDMGTVVFPNAEVKFFLDASHKVRAKRRFEEMGPSPSITLEELERDIKVRDDNDRNRAVAPLKPAEDAELVDASDISAEVVVNKMFEFIKRKNVL